MRRPQFSLKTLLWLMALVAAFLGGMALQKRLDRPTIRRMMGPAVMTDFIEMPDGTVWARTVMPPDDSSEE
ncbi:MAG TPA: hypothetical protein VG206_14215 [Terriglobia bacterium]|nr:hypothetical protein [Terriglobia bacterium]